MTRIIPNMTRFNLHIFWLRFVLNLSFTYTFQSQSVDIFPRKVLDILMEIRYYILLFLLLLVFIHIWSFNFICLINFYSYFMLSSFSCILMWRDLAGILLELSREFNIDKFLSILMDSLVEYRWDWDFSCVSICMLWMI